MKIISDIVPKILKPRSAIVLFIFVLSIGINAQQADTCGRALNFPFRHYGISIGNSRIFSGLRMNFSDRHVKRVNGVNLNMWTRFKHGYNEEAVISGISVNGIAVASQMQFINLFILGGICPGGLNGISIAAVGCGGGSVNGLCAGGFIVGGSYLNGIQVSSFITYADSAVNGMALSVFSVYSRNNINGLAASVCWLQSDNSINGLALTPGYLHAYVSRGITIAGYANVSRCKGLSVALVNRSRDLHGVQIGLLNIAKNNRKGLRVLPLINAHLAQKNMEEATGKK